MNNDSPSHSTHLESEISQALSAALRFIERRGIDTYDPLDPSTTELAQRLLTVRTRFGTVVRKLLWAGVYLAPQTARRWLGVVPKATPGGVANLASLYVELGGAENLAKARRCLEWLETNATFAHGYVGWGFPFSWKQKLLVVSGTPIGHTTMTCGNAFLKYFQATGDQSVLPILERLCGLFHSGLRHSVRPSGSIAVSYTPLDETQVINIQADIGSLLCRVGKLQGDERHRRLGSALIRCVLETQNKDGSWCYYAPDSTGSPSYIDTHHTGMVLSALCEAHDTGCFDTTGVSRIENAICTGTNYFLENLFTPEGLPKYYDTSLYPVETYNFAQSIITFLDLAPFLREQHILSRRLEERLLQVTTLLLGKMQTREGGFLYRRTRLVKQDMGSLRWANALASTALARYRRLLRNNYVDASPTAHFQSA